MMLVGAVMGFWAVQRTGSLSVANCVAAIAGAEDRLIHAFLCVTLPREPDRLGAGSRSSRRGGAVVVSRNDLTSRPARASCIRPICRTGGARERSRAIFFNHSAIVYASWICVAWCGVPEPHAVGLNLRSVGEAPAAADCDGVNSPRIATRTR